MQEVNQGTNILDLINEKATRVLCDFPMLLAKYVPSIAATRGRLISQDREANAARFYLIKHEGTLDDCIARLSDPKDESDVLEVVFCFCLNKSPMSCKEDMIFLAKLCSGHFIIVANPGDDDEEGKQQWQGLVGDIKKHLGETTINVDLISLNDGRFTTFREFLAVEVAGTVSGFGIDEILRKHKMEKQAISVFHEVVNSQSRTPMAKNRYHGSRFSAIKMLKIIREIYENRSEPFDSDIKQEVFFNDMRFIVSYIEEHTTSFLMQKVSNYIVNEVIEKHLQEESKMAVEIEIAILIERARTNMEKIIRNFACILKDANAALGRDENHAINVLFFGFGDTIRNAIDQIPSIVPFFYVPTDYYKEDYYKSVVPEYQLLKNKEPFVNDYNEFIQKLARYGIVLALALDGTTRIQLVATETEGTRRMNADTVPLMKYITSQKKEKEIMSMLEAQETNIVTCAITETCKHEPRESFVRRQITYGIETPKLGFENFSVVCTNLGNFYNPKRFKPREPAKPLPPARTRPNIDIVECPPINLESSKNIEDLGPEFTEHEAEII